MQTNRCPYIMERLELNRNRLIFLIFLTINYLVSDTNQLPVYGKGSLYGPEDFVYSLNGTTVKDEIFFSNRAWMVEFYSSWYGHTYVLTLETIFSLLKTREFLNENVIYFVGAVIALILHRNGNSLLRI